MGRQACLDHQADPGCLGFSASPVRLGHRVRPIRLGRQVNPTHLGHRARFQIYHELKNIIKPKINIVKIKFYLTRN